MNWRIVEGNVSAQFFPKIHFTLANCSCYFIYLVEYCVWELKNESTRKIKIQFSININHLTSFIQHSRLHPEFKSFERNRRWIIDHLWRFAFCGLAFYATKNWPIFFINLMINLRCKIRFYHFLAWCEDFRNKKERITSIRTNIVRTTWKDAVSLEANLKIHFFFELFRCITSEKKYIKLKSQRWNANKKIKSIQVLAISQSKQFSEAMFQVVLFNVTVIFMALKIACYANLFACFYLKLIDLEKNAINCSFTLIDWIKRKMYYSQTKFMLHVKSEFQFILLKQTKKNYQQPNSNIPISLSK